MVNIAAQNASDTSIFTQIVESVFVHSNTSTLLSGETFYYKFYTWNIHTKSFSQISKIGYVELIKKNGESVLKQKIRLTNGMGNGDFFIPAKLKTGSYKFLAYTRWMLNEPLSKIFQSDIFIINPFQSAPEGFLAKVKNDSLKTSSKIISNRTKNSKNDQVLSLKNSIYGTRKKVTFSLSSADAQLKKGHYSISVRKIDDLPEKESINAHGFIDLLDKHFTKDNTNSNYLPELRGELIVGEIQNKNAPQDINNKNIALSLPGKNFVFKLASTNDNGIFRFILDEERDKKNAIIQVMEDDRENYNIRLDSISIDYSLLQFKKFPLTNDLKETIEKRSIAVQIENAYFYLKKDSVLPEKKSNPFFHPIAEEYILENYTSFPSMEKTIVEIVPTMYFTKKNGNYTIHTRDYYNNITNNIYQETLILVDGLVLQNVNKLFEYDTRKIHKISVVPRGYIYGAKIFDGVVNFTTKKQDFQNNLSGGFMLKKKLLRPLPEKIYFQPSYAKDKSLRIPDFRYQLLWLPEVYLTDKTKTISFYTSDIKGTFEIVLEGFTASGKPISAHKTFIVK